MFGLRHNDRVEIGITESQSSLGFRTAQEGTEASCAVHGLFPIFFMLDPGPSPVGGVCDNPCEHDGHSRDVFAKMSRSDVKPLCPSPRVPLSALYPQRLQGHGEQSYLQTKSCLNTGGRWVVYKVRASRTIILRLTLWSCKRNAGHQTAL